MADDASSKPTHLEPSELGTKEYWDNLYTNELTNHSHNPSDKGTKESTSFLDLGCGNGSLLFALREEGWQGRCLGVDYSEKSVALARQIAASEDQADNERVEFEVWDVLQGAYDTTGGWDVVHDKGTFDAISLSEERDAAGRRICEGYKGRIVRLVRPGGLFLVTSCNWTEEELEGWFGEASAAVEGGRFVRVGRVNYPSFSFGGVKGQTISTVCYQKL
ncbi:hypothetical protein VMCG_00231 [Cytospora schulzeri]|uniref:Protein-lysine N-methyltransferase EFM4 n=1 Tax=Cytospora schulzeri TaxID=448051 RepID=A0A423X9F5_9PEZI|nr:hypothetical protein VMCG_00231 [Valsa malicola]